MKLRQCLPSRVGGAAMVCGLALATGLPARADMIELTNGDHYRGIVISMTLSNVDFLSEIQGRVKLPRDKIANIVLKEVTPKTTALTNAAAGNSSATAAVKPPTAQPLILSGAPATASASPDSAVVQKMRQDGVDAKLVQQVQEQIFGKASPEAAQKFNDLMGGLMSGQVSVRDLRAQAQNSIAQIQAAKKEFGPDAGEMLDGYLGILEKFVQESASDNTITAAPGK